MVDCPSEKPKFLYKLNINNMLTGEFLRDSAQRFPERVALVDGSRRMSYGELDAYANRFAHALLSLPLTESPKISILSSNRLEYAIAYFGAARCGYTLAHISTKITIDNLVYMLEQIGTEVILFESRAASLVKSAVERIGGTKHLIELGTSAGVDICLVGAMSFADLVDGQSTEVPLVKLEELMPLGITFTGGTTGFPKAVLVNHKARYATACAALMDFGLDERDIVAVTTPMFHSAGLYVWFAPAIMLGATVVMLPGWDVNQFMATVENERVTAAFFVPSQLSDLVSHADFSSEKLASLQKIGYAGAPMSRALLERVHAVFPDVEFTENYGQSEICPITIRSPHHPKDKLDSVGKPAFNIEIQVVGSDGLSLSTGEIGEIVTRGDPLFECYYNDPKQTEEAFPKGDGWLWTGDMGFLDKDGFLTLMDRSKDMLVSGGENIYPAEIENALYHHEAIEECAVFGVPDEKWGEVPIAHVVLASGVSISEDELISFCATRIPRHKRPRQIKFVESLPRTPVGKIKKVLLRRPYWDRLKKNI